MGKRLGDISTVVTMDNSDSFIIIINGQEWLITKENLQKVFKGLTSEEYNALSKIIVNGNGTKFLNDSGVYVDLINEFDREQFNKTNGKITVIGYHTHSNLELLEKFTVDENDTLYFNGEKISSYTLPVASTANLGGVKVDGTTITVSEDGTISGVNTYILPTASNTTLGGVKVDNDTIKINDGVISADVIGNWSAGVSYPVGYFVVYENKLYECTTVNSDTVFDESKWLLIAGNVENGTVINDWTADTEYAIGDLAIKDNALIRCIEAHTSTAEIDMTKWVSLSGAKGDKGDKGDNGVDGVSPTATITSTNTGATISITDKNGTTTSILTNGTDGITPHIDATTKHWFIGETDTGVVAEGITTLQTTSVKYTGTLTVDGWIGETAPFIQTINIADITSELSPIIDLIISDDINVGIKENNQWGNITKAVTNNGSISFYCYETKPDIELNIMIEVI